MVKSLGVLVAGGQLAEKALCILDADEEEATGCLRLPGSGAPEVDVFEALEETDWEPLATRIGGVTAGALKEAIQDAMNLDDHHKWCAHVADSLGGTLTRRRVWEELAEYYARDKIATVERTDCGPYQGSSVVIFVSLFDVIFPPKSSEHFVQTRWATTRTDISCGFEYAASYLTAHRLP